MRLGAVIGVACGIVGCASSVTRDLAADSAEITMPTQFPCDEPGARLYFVRRVGAEQPLSLADDADHVAVSPGRYEIYVVCQNPINEARGICTFWDHSNEHRTYRMRLRSGVRYSFQCYETNGDVRYRISEGEPLFSFRPIPNNAAYSDRKFSPDEMLTVAVTEMKNAERLSLERCGNDRCSVAAPVTEWTSSDFEQRGRAEVRTESDRYVFLLFNLRNGVRGVLGANATVEDGVTILRFESGTTVRVEVRSLH
jgi:hypothetical protein